MHVSSLTNGGTTLDCPWLASRDADTIPSLTGCVVLCPPPRNFPCPYALFLDICISPIPRPLLFTLSFSIFAPCRLVTGSSCLASLTFFNVCCPSSSIPTLSHLYSRSAYPTCVTSRKFCKRIGISGFFQNIPETFLPPGHKLIIPPFDHAVSHSSPIGDYFLHLTTGKCWVGAISHCTTTSISASPKYTEFLHRQRSDWY